MQFPYSKKKEHILNLKNRNYIFLAKFKRETNRFGHFLTFSQLFSALSLVLLAYERRRNGRSRKQKLFLKCLLLLLMGERKMSSPSSSSPSPFSWLGQEREKGSDMRTYRGGLRRILPVKL